MTISTESLLEGLNSVVSIPLIPFNDGKIDYDGHAKNIDYLMNNNTLSNNRPRVISIAGTSLVHHVKPEEQIKLIDIAGQRMGDKGILMAALIPNPIGVASDMIETLSKLNRPPDVYLIMPLGGTYSPEGLYETFMQFGEHHANKHNARFLYYYRRPRDREVIIRLLQDSPHFIGVKIGTNVSDVTPFIDALDDSNIVMWGIGDRSTAAAELGAKGHTSGINVVVAKASDAINNAQLDGDYAKAKQVEADIAPLEEIRFVNERAYNYSAVMEAIIELDTDDVEAGTGGPFNPRVPADVATEIKTIVENIRQYH
jgi:dihydrodipicolinate synthase/N-acetylneuraminate lyase